MLNSLACPKGSVIFAPVCLWWMIFVFKYSAIMPFVDFPCSVDYFIRKDRVLVHGVPDYGVPGCG